MIKSEIRNNTGLITFNRPEKRNALNPEMSSLIREKLGEFALDGNIKAVILTGEGTSFCAGADLSWLNKIKDYSSVRNEEDTESVFGRLHGSLPDCCCRLQGEGPDGEGWRVD